MPEKPGNPENGPELRELSDAEIAEGLPEWAGNIQDVVGMGAGFDENYAFEKLGLKAFGPRTVAKIKKGLGDLGIKGLTDNDKAAPKAAPAKTTPPDPPQRQQKEPDERKERREGRQFKGYDLVGNGTTTPFAIRERFEEHGRSREVRTDIDIPPKIAEKMEKDEEYREKIRKFSEDVRQEIDRSTNVYFDESKPGEYVPKWKSPKTEDSWPETDGRTLKEHKEKGIDPDIIPIDVLEQVKRVFESRAALREKVLNEKIRTNPDFLKKYEQAADKKAYIEQFISDRPGKPGVPDLREQYQFWHDKEPYSKWIGLAKQRKREQIISNELAKMASMLEKDPEPEKEAVPAEKEHAVEKAPAAEVELEQIIEAETSAEAEKRLVKAELKKWLKDLLVVTEHIFNEPEEVKRSVARLEELANGFLRNAPKMSPLSKLSPAEVSAAIRDIMRLKFANDEEMIKALDDVEPTTTVEKEPKFSKEYEDLRREAEASLNNETAIKAFQDKLMALKKGGDAPTSEAAQKIYNEIEYGRLGELSETRMAGQGRSLQEAKFFSAHPLIDRRNVGLLDNGKMKIYLDRADIEKSAERALRNLVLDAMFPGDPDPKPDASQEATIKKVAAHLYKNIDLWRDTGEMTIKKPAELPDLILKVAERLKKEQP